MPTAGGEGSARFENPADDFAQRISYTREEPNQLRVVIEGEREGQTRQIGFVLVRMASA